MKISGQNILEINEGNPHWECTEAENKCNSMIRIMGEDWCYDSMLKVSSKELTLVLSDTRELDRVPSTE